MPLRRKRPTVSSLFQWKFRGPAGFNIYGTHLLYTPVKDPKSWYQYESWNALWDIVLLQVESSDCHILFSLGLFFGHSLFTHFCTIHFFTMLKYLFHSLYGKGRTDMLIMQSFGVWRTVCSTVQSLNMNISQDQREVKLNLTLRQHSTYFRLRPFDCPQRNYGLRSKPLAICRPQYQNNGSS